MTLERCLTSAYVSVCSCDCYFLNREGDYRRQNRSDVTQDVPFSVGGQLYFIVGGKARKPYIGLGAGRTKMGDFHNMMVSISHQQ